MRRYFLVLILFLLPLSGNAESINLNIGPGVSSSQANAVIEGMDASIAYFQTAFGYRFEGPANAYLSSDPAYLARAMVRERRIPDYLAQATQDWTNARESEAAYRHLLMRSNASAFTNGAQALPPMLSHEVFHLLQYERVGSKSRNCCDQEQVSVVGPTWLMEGAATYAAFRFMADVHGRNLRLALGRSEAIAKRMNGSLKNLETGNGFYAVTGSYDIGAFATHLLIQRSGPESILAFYGKLKRTRNWKRAFNEVFGLSVAEFYAQFDAL